MKLRFHECNCHLDITPDDVVLEIGGYLGEGAAHLAQSGALVRVFEPVPEFYNKCVNRCREMPNVSIFNYGIGSHPREEFFSVKGDSTGLFVDGQKETKVYMAGYVWKTAFGGRIALAKINCEGGEYELLDDILNQGAAGNFRNIMVQPHTCVPDYEARWASINKRLLVTHDLVFCEPWVWSLYTLRK